MTATDLAARLGPWKRISSGIAMRAYGWIGRGHGWDWQVELSCGAGLHAEMLSPRQARLMAQRLLALAEQCDRANHARDEKTEGSDGD